MRPVRQQAPVTASEPLTVVHTPGHAAPIRVSRHRAVYAMKTEVRGYGAGWPLHVEISADNQVFLLRTVRVSHKRSVFVGLV